MLKLLLGLIWGFWPLVNQINHRKFGAAMGGGRPEAN